MNRRTHRSRLALIVAASVLLAAFATLSFGRRISQRAPWVGVEWVETGLGVTAITVDPKSPAAEAGLLPGDVLVSVGGRSAVSVLSAADAAWRVPHGAAVSLGNKNPAVLEPGERVRLNHKVQWRQSFGLKPHRKDGPQLRVIPCPVDGPLCDYDSFVPCPV